MAGTKIPVLACRESLVARYEVANPVNGAREVLFAYGLRNPWRISDPADKKRWAGDVG